MHILENREEWVETFRNGWLAHYLTTGEKDWRRYNRPRNSQAPTGPGIDLARSRLLLISSAGAYLRDGQERFDDRHYLGDSSLRLIPSDTPLNRLAFSHSFYDHAAVEADPQVLVPLRHLEDLVSEGVIGELAPHFISFMGYQPDVTTLLDETIPAILDAARAERADGALLVPA